MTILPGAALAHDKQAYYIPAMPEHAPPPSLGFLLSDTARLMRRRFDQKARHLGLTRAQQRSCSLGPAIMAWRAT